MALQFFRPWEDLRDVVVRIYAHDSPASEIADPRWLIVPDGELKLIFPFRGDIRCTIGEAERLHAESRLIFSGIRTKPGHLHFPTGVGAIGVILRPDAAYRLFGLPQHQVANRTLDGEELFGNAARVWQEALMHPRRLDDRVVVIQRLLRGLLRQRNRQDAVFEHALHHMKSHAGLVRIDWLAAELGWSLRKLDRVFQERVGIGPKSLASVLRFHAVYKRVRDPGRGVRDARLIYDYYFDQSHFLKDFRRYTGTAPRGYEHVHDYGRFYIPDV